VDIQDLTIVSITHDLTQKRSFVMVLWDKNPDKRLSLPVPFDLRIEDLIPATKIALQELKTEMENARLKLANDFPTR
jgi:hypothetical protein